MKVLIAGGGTGGHLFSGVAVADRLKAEGGHRIRFVGTRRGIEARVLPELGYDVRFISVGGLKRMGIVKTAANLLKLPWSLVQSLWLVLTFWPDVAMGVGGYASGPVMLAAWLLMRPTVIIEQNSRPGVTNKVLGKLVRVVVTHFAHAERYFKAEKVRRLGNPVRLDASTLDRSRRVGEDETLNILITGGSQGAHAINAAMAEAAAALAAHNGRLRIVHQCGPADVDMLRAAYENHKLDAEVSAFIDDMIAAYLAADLVIARAGAGTVCELSIVGRPALFVPLPTAADDHQTINAAELSEAQAAWVKPQAELSAEWLADFIGQLLDDRDQLSERAERAARVGKPNAAKDVAALLHELAD